MADQGVEYSEQHDDSSGFPPRERFQKFQLTDEEIKVLRECRTTSFYYRGVPGGILSLIATRYLAHNHFPHLKKYSGLYYTGALTMGMIVGVVSYRQKCFEKIMALDNSRLADEVRKFQQRVTGQGGNIACELESDDDWSQKHSQSRTPLYQPRGSNQRPSAPSYRVNEDQDSEGSELQSTTYEELRKRHRESRMQGPKRLPKLRQPEAEDPVGGDSYDPDVSYDRRETYSPGSSWENSSPQTSYEEKTKSKIQPFPQDRPRRNKYGDEME